MDEEDTMKQATNTPVGTTILSRHAIGDRLLVTRFRTRYGNTLWMLDTTDETGEELRELIFQGDRKPCMLKVREIVAVGAF